MLIYAFLFFVGIRIKPYKFIYIQNKYRLRACILNQDICRFFFRKPSTSEALILRHTESHLLIFLSFGFQDHLQKSNNLINLLCLTSSILLQCTPWFSLASTVSIFYKASHSYHGEWKVGPSKTSLFPIC